MCLNTLGCDEVHVRRAVSSPPAHQQQQGGRSLGRSVTCCLLIRDNDTAAAIRLLSAGLKVQLESSTQKTGGNLKVEMPSSGKRPAESCAMRKMRIYLSGNARFWGIMCVSRSN